MLTWCGADRVRGYLLRRSIGLDRCLRVDASGFEGPRRSCTRATGRAVATCVSGSDEILKLLHQFADQTHLDTIGRPVAHPLSGDRGIVVLGHAARDIRDTVF